MEWHVKKFAELDALTLYQILKLRAEVFVVEQTCPYLDPDDKDLKSIHVYGKENNSVLAYARIVEPGVSYDTPSIGRVVTSQLVRGKGAGKELMKRTLDACRQSYPEQKITISAQCYLEKFYLELGFETASDPYPEDDIPHIKMILKARKNSA